MDTSIRIYKKKLHKFLPRFKGTTVLRFVIILLLLLYVVSLMVSFHKLISGSKINPFIMDNGNYAIPRDLDRSYR